MREHGLLRADDCQLGNGIRDDIRQENHKHHVAKPAEHPRGPPLALSQASGSARALLGKVGSALSLGMKFTTKLAVDAAFTGAEAINCSIPP
jgi:hypothetical protein